MSKKLEPKHRSDWIFFTLIAVMLLIGLAAFFDGYGLMIAGTS